MYNDYFGFREPPFSIAPDPRYLYMTAQHREALAHLVYGLNSDGGCILLTGEVGTGKTTICRCLLEQIPEQAHVALLLNPKVSEIELLETICDELKIPYPESGNSVKTYTDLIYQFLIESHRNNEKTVLIIDEAQNLSAPVLEQLRLLTNLETHQRKLLQIIILGQPELLDILASPEMRQLAQRITARYHLQPLDREEVRAYINHRLAVAGQNIQLFPDESVRLLYRLSNGVPRLINILCDRALLGAYVENRPAAAPSIVKKAASEVFGELKNVERKKQTRRWLLPAGLAAGLAIVLAAALLAARFDLPPLRDATGGSDSTDTLPHGNTPGQNDQGSAEEHAQTTETADIAAPEQLAPKQSATEAAPETADDPAVAVPDRNADTGLTDTGLTGASDNTATNITASRNIAEQNSPEPGNSDAGALFADALDSQSAGRAEAYEALFALWNIPYNRKTATTMCRQAAASGLSCLHKQGNLNSLRMHNRPAVLTLLNSRGEPRQVTLGEISHNTATLYFNNKNYRLELSELDRYWYGSYILLWKKPPLYTRAITPGEDSRLVPWLDTQLAGILHEDKLGSDRYDKALARRVRAFQQQQGLKADGIVGPLTLIHINTLSDSDLPTLVKAG